MYSIHLQINKSSDLVLSYTGYCDKISRSQELMRPVLTSVGLQSQEDDLFFTGKSRRRGSSPSSATQCVLIKTTDFDS